MPVLQRERVVIADAVVVSLSDRHKARVEWSGGQPSVRAPVILSAGGAGVHIRIDGLSQIVAVIGHIGHRNHVVSVELLLHLKAPLQGMRCEISGGERRYAG